MIADDCSDLFLERLTILIEYLLHLVINFYPNSDSLSKTIEIISSLREIQKHNIDVISRDKPST